MGRINKFRSVVNSTMGILTSRNFDYNGYWFPGFIFEDGCDFTFDLNSNQSFNKIHSDCIKAINSIIERQIIINDLTSYKIKSAKFRFKNIIDTVYSCYGRDCKKVNLELEIITETGRVYKCLGNLFTDKHDLSKEKSRIG